MKKKLILFVSFEEASSIADFCERKGRSPLEVLLTICGGQSSEPFLFDIEKFIDPKKCHAWQEIESRKIEHRRIKGEQNNVYLELLSQLFKWDKVNVSAAFNKQRGRKRSYFSMVRKEVDQPLWIPSSDPAWYACTKLACHDKQKILRELLCDLGFTYSYSCRTADLTIYKRPRIAELRFESDEAS